MVSPIRRHADLLEQRETALARRRDARPTQETDQSGGASRGRDAAHGDAGHRRIDALEAGPGVRALLGPVDERRGRLSAHDTHEGHAHTESQGREMSAAERRAETQAALGFSDVHQDSPEARQSAAEATEKTRAALALGAVQREDAPQKHVSAAERSEAVRASLGLGSTEVEASDVASNDTPPPAQAPQEGERLSAAEAAQQAREALGIREEQEAEERGPAPSDLSAEDLEQVEGLRRRDAEVRRHEQAHAAVGGAYAGAPNYELERGPDGSMYAVGGQVRIDVSPVPGDPEATVRKMKQVRQAALAPAEPSPQDRRVAAKAIREEAKAQAELRDVEASTQRVTAEGPPDAKTELEDPTPAGQGSFSVMTLHAQRAYRQSEPPPSS